MEGTLLPQGGGLLPPNVIKIFGCKASENKKSLHPCHKMTLGRRHLRGTTQIAAKAAALKTPITEGIRRNLFRKLRGGIRNRLQTFLSASERLSVIARFPVIPIKA